MEQDYYKYSKNDKQYKTIDGSYCRGDNRVGFCWSSLHKGSLTKKQMEKHKCIEKNCPSFQKYENSTYWQVRDRDKSKKKEAKNRAKELKRKKAEYLQKMREATFDDHNVYVVDVEIKDVTSFDKKRYVARIITFNPIDYSHYQNIFANVCDGVRFHFEQVKTTTERKRQIIEMQAIPKNPKPSQVIVHKPPEPIPEIPVISPDTKPSVDVTDKPEIKPTEKSVLNRFIDWIKKIFHPKAG